MRSVLSRIRLFNDTFLDIRHLIYIKQKRRGREQDSRETETERECVCVRDRVSLTEVVASVVKWTVGETFNR